MNGKSLHFEWSKFGNETLFISKLGRKEVISVKWISCAHNRLILYHNTLKSRQTQIISKSINSLGPKI